MERRQGVVTPQPLFFLGYTMAETEKPSARHWNVFPECVGLELSAPQGGGQAFGLNAELIFGQQPLSGQGVSFRLGIKTGFLRVELKSCEIVSGTRFAVLDQPATAEQSVKKEETASTSIEAKGSGRAKLGLGMKGLQGVAGLDAAASGARANKRTVNYTQEGTEQIHKVTARGTNSEPSWEIRDSDNPILDGRYLGLENLCEIAPEEEDGWRVTAQFECRKRDLGLSELEASGWRLAWPTTKEKLALAVVAKALGTDLERLQEGALALCRSQLGARADEDDGDERR
jgi:hypothetical protein